MPRPENRAILGSMLRMRARLLLLLVVAAFAVTVFAGTASAGWTWDEAATGWTWDGVDGSPPDAP